MYVHEFVVAADCFRDLGFGDPDTYDVQSRGYNCQVLL